MATKSLSAGRQLEFETLGRTLKPGQSCCPPKRQRSFKSQRRRRPLRSSSGIPYSDFETALEKSLTADRVIGRPDNWPRPGSMERRLYWYVSRRFPKSRQKLMMYFAVGTALDLYHGVDFLFWLNGQVVTLDVSLREGKEHKADFLLTPSVLGDYKRLGRFMEEVARRLNPKRIACRS